MRIIWRTSGLAFSPVVCYVVVRPVNGAPLTDTWDDWVLVQQANDWAVWCCQWGWGVSVWIWGMVEKCIFVWLSRTMYLSTKSAARGKGFMSTAVAISLSLLSGTKDGFRKLGWPTKYSQGCLSRQSPSLGLIEECPERPLADTKEVLWSSHCSSHCLCVLLPFAVPRLPGQTQGSFSCYLSSLSPSSPPPTLRPGQVGCFVAFWSVTGGPCPSSLGSVFVCGGYGSGGQRWTSSFGPMPRLKTGIPSQPLLRFVTSRLVQKLKVCVCVVSNIYEGESP